MNDRRITHRSARSVALSPSAWTVDLIAVADAEIPGPQLYWMRSFNEWFPITFQVVVLRNNEYTVLINAGLPEDIGPYNASVVAEMGDRSRVLARRPLIDQLGELDVHAESVTHVILSPLQWYTTGTIPYFPSATICLSERGWVHFHTTHDHPHDVRARSIPETILRHLVTDAWPRVRLLADEERLLPGLRTWWSGGHHRASIVIEIDTAQGTVAVTDAAFHAANVADNIPLGINESLEETLLTYSRLRGADHLIALYDPTAQPNSNVGLAHDGR